MPSSDYLCLVDNTYGPDALMDACAKVLMNFLWMLELTASLENAAIDYGGAGRWLFLYR